MILEKECPTGNNCKNISSDECLDNVVDPCLDKCESYQKMIEKGDKPESLKDFDKTDILEACNSVQNSKFAIS